MNLKWLSKGCVIRALFVIPVLLALATMPASAYNNQYYSAPALQEISLSALPMGAKDTLRLIKQGGPFPYPRDGVVFGNREKLLPKKKSGYYHEYTVKTPGARNRGARRIVCGQPLDCYYSDDHYQTFKLIRE